MRLLAALALCGGCGRISFDELSGTPRDATTDTFDARKFFIDGGECPPGYTFDTLGCYRAVMAPNTAEWIAAEADCEQDGFGTHLVVIDSPGETTVVDRQEPGTVLSHWLGVTDIVTEGSFVDVFGRPSTYTNWAASEPSGGMASNCVLFYDDTTITTQACTVSDDYVCEYDGVPPVPAAWGQ